MKCRLLLILLFQLCIVSLYSQSGILERKVKISITEGKIGIILKEIADKGDFSFSFSQDIPVNKTVKLSNPKQTVEQFLKEIFGADVYCIEYGNKIILKNKPLLPENYAIRGRVIDKETKEPIPGVTVIIPDSDPLIGSVSNAEGFFQVVVPTSINMVSLSCMGYAPELILSENDEPVMVELNPAYQELQEVEILYYTKPKSARINGSVSKVESVRIEKSPVSNISTSLQGNISGVHVIRNSGMPGASLQVKIRGVNSLLNSEPAYYLNGIYIQKTSLYSLSPHDIEKIEVIKDASGTAKYGASAGNGVVLLHSRKVDNKKLSAKLNYYHGIQKVWKTPDLMTLDEYRDFFNENRPEGEDFDTLLELSNKNWIDELFHNAKTEDIHFSVSGGNKVSDLYFSSGFYNQEAIIKELSLKRYTFNLNSSHKVNDRLNIGQNLSFANIEFKGLKEGSFLNDINNPLLSSMILPPSDSLIDPRGIPVSSDHTVFNPNDDFELSNNIRKNYALQGQVNALVELIPDLSYSSRFGFETYFQDNTSYTRTNSNNNDINKNFTGYIYNILDLSYNWQQSLEYRIDVKDKHVFQLSLNYESGHNKNEWIPLNNKHYVNSLDSVNDVTEREKHNYTRYRYEGDFSYNAYWATFNYIFKGRYSVHSAIRNEKVSYQDREQKNINISDIYPSLSLGWIFMNDNSSIRNILSYGKLRFGWGKAGNSPRINYSFFAKMMRDVEYVYAFQSTREITHSYKKRQTNERFYWESTKSQNVGIDLGLISNRIFLTVDYFSNQQFESNTYPLHKPKELIQVINNMPDFGIIQLPSAKIRNKGVDIELTIKHTTQKFSGNLGFVFSHLKNKIVAVDQAYLDNIGSNDYLDILSRNNPGEAVGSFYGYKIDRLFTTEDYQPGTRQIINQPYVVENDSIIYAQPYAKAGDYKFEDINNDGRIDEHDKTIIGNPFPDFSFGLFGDIQFYNFDLSVLVQGSYGNEIFNATKMWLYNPYGLSNWSSDIINSYNEETNTNTTLHRYDFYNENRNLRVSDFYIEDGSYLRLKNIMLGYTINPESTRKFHVQKLRFYICVQNLFTLTNYTGMDPEVGGWGIDCGTYPQPRVYMAGLNVEF